MVLRYLCLSIPFQNIKVCTQQRWYNTTLVVFIWRNVQEKAESLKQEVLSAEIFVYCLYAVVDMQFLVDMIHMFAYSFRADKKVVSDFFIQQAF